MHVEKAYKLLTMKNGKLYPMYVFSREETPLGEWLTAKDGERLPNGKVKARTGALAFRPGWHLAPVPNAPWIGLKTEDGMLVRRTDNVWCEAEYVSDIDYSGEAHENGWKDGKWAYVRACLRHAPENGFYRYRTNPFGDEWIIAGKIRLLRILSDEEVRKICLENGVEPQETETEYTERKRKQAEPSSLSSGI